MTWPEFIAWVEAHAQEIDLDHTRIRYIDWSCEPEFVKLNDAQELEIF